MKNLVYKEFKLSAHATSFIFLLLSPMLLIPNYPYYVAFFYQTLGIFFMFLNGNTTNDIHFTTLLPVRKRDAVKARVITVLLFELLQIVVSIPFAILRSSLIPLQNAVGVEANIALFGLALMMFGVFNIVFLPAFYQTAYKTGIPYLLSCAAMTVFILVVEIPIQTIPGLKAALDTIDPAYIPQQLAVLGAGLLLYALLTWLAYRQSARRFERLDL